MGEPWRHTRAWALAEEAGDIVGRPSDEWLLDPAQAPERTADAQLAVFVTSLMTWTTAKDDIGPVAGFAGHSLGQLSALVAAGALTFEDGVRLVARRGEVTQALADRVGGAMVALLGADPGQAQDACEAAPGACWVANDNAPGQVVLAGTKDGVARAGEAALANGARRVIPVRVDGPFHTPLMAPAAEALADALETTAFAPPVAPVVSNADARPYIDSVAWAPRLAWHLVRPVLWRQSLQTLAALGVRRFVEVGPGGVLTGLARRTVPDATVQTVAGPEDVAHLAGAAA
jgi:[acyl-carrier-protein] S-malonyltransferase